MKNQGDRVRQRSEESTQAPFQISHRPQVVKWFCAQLCPALLLTPSRCPSACTACWQRRIFDWQVPFQQIQRSSDVTSCVILCVFTSGTAVHFPSGRFTSWTDCCGWVTSDGVSRSQGQSRTVSHAGLDWLLGKAVQQSPLCPKAVYVSFSFFCINLFNNDMDKLYASTSCWDSCRMGCCSTALNQTLSSDIGLLIDVETQSNLILLIIIEVESSIFWLITKLQILLKYLIFIWSIQYTLVHVELSQHCSCPKRPCLARFSPQK